MNSSIFLWKTRAIALSAVIISFIGGFLISGTQAAHAQQVNHNYTAAVNPGPGSITADTKTAPPTSAKPKVATHKKTIKKAVAKAADTTTVQQEQTPLDEMVVMGMAGGNNKAESTNNEAHPKTGWSTFETYLKEKANTPDGRIGTVKVSFIVNSDGSCTGYKIKAGLTEASDKKAIQLVKSGPAWIGNANGEAKETIVDVQFH